MFLNNIENNIQDIRHYETYHYGTFQAPRFAGNFLTNPPTLSNKDDSTMITESFGVRLKDGVIEIIMEGTDIASYIRMPIHTDLNMACFSRKMPLIDGGTTLLSRKHEIANLERFKKARYNVRQQDGTSEIEFVLSDFGVGLSIPLGPVEGYNCSRSGLERALQMREQSSPLYIQYTELASNPLIGNQAATLVTVSMDRDSMDYVPYILDPEMTDNEFTGLKCLMSFDIESMVSLDKLVKRGCFGVFSTNEDNQLIVENKSPDNLDSKSRKRRLDGTWLIPPTEQMSVGISYDTYRQVALSRGNRNRSVRRSIIQLIDLCEQEISEVSSFYTCSFLVGLTENALVLGVEYTAHSLEILGWDDLRMLRMIRNQYPYINSDSEPIPIPIEITETIVEIESDIEQAWYEAACRMNRNMAVSSANPKDWFMAYMNECVMQGDTVSSEHIAHFNTLE